MTHDMSFLVGLEAVRENEANAADVFLWFGRNTGYGSLSHRTSKDGASYIIPSGVGRQRWWKKGALLFTVCLFFASASTAFYHRS